jgi:glutaminyl-peptide cyclotransferase
VQPLKVSPITEHLHDTSRYTEGLEFYKGHLYESVGRNGLSFLIKYDTGSTTKGNTYKITDPTIFAEGITILLDTIYQLTYQSKKVLLYDATTLKPIGTMPWTNGEGWGLTNNGKQLIASNGTNIIYFLNPKDLKVERTINVKMQGNPVEQVNELEYVDGFIYANVFTTDNILKIDEATGHVIAMAQLNNLLPGFDAASMQQVNGEKFLNGIAYNPKSQTFLISGKNWPKTFEVKLQ